MSCYKLVAYLENTTLEATTYYSDQHIAVTSEYVRIGEHTFPPSDIDSGDVRTRILVAPVSREYLLIGSILALYLVGMLVALFRGAMAVILGISKFVNVYAQDWLDFIFPVISAFMSLFLLFMFRGPRLSVTLKLRSGRTSDSTSIKWMSPIMGFGHAVSVTALGDALRKVAPHARFTVQGKALEAENAPPPENTLYWDGTTAVTPEYVQYRGKRLPIAGITNTEISVHKPNSIWFLLPHLFSTPVTLLISVSMIVTNPPIVQDGVTYFSRLWLFALSLLFISVPIVFGHVSKLRRRNKDSIYIVKVGGFFGRYNPDVLFTTEILHTPDQTHANNVRATLEYAVSRRTEYPIVEVERTPLAGYQGT